MSLYETEFENDGTEYRIVCEDAASGLDGIDGKAWLFTVTDPANGKAVQVQAGIQTDLLVKWQEAADGESVSNAELIQLLAEHLKLDLEQGLIDPDVVTDTEREVLTQDTAEDSYSAERARLADLVS